jgi:hypothetical protein
MHDKRHIDPEAELNALYLAADHSARKNGGGRPKGYNKPKATPPRPDSTPEQDIDVPSIPGGPTKVDADIARIKAQTAKLHIELAQQMKILVLKELVDNAWGKIYSTAVNYLLPMGQRLAPTLCKKLGVTDPELILEIQNLIDDEVQKAVGQIKRVTTEAISE